MTGQRIGAWIAIIIGAIYFFVPLLGTLEFSLRMRRGVYSFDAYRSVFSDPQFQETFGYSMLMALLTIVFGMLLVVPTAYWVRLRVPQMRQIVEFITLLPLVIPAIVIVFGYLRMYNSSSILPLTGFTTGTNILLVISYITLALPYMYRSVDTAMRAIDVRTLTEAAESLGASWTTIMFKCIFPNVMSGVLSGAFITLAIVMGEFTFAALLNRPAFGPYLQLVGANKAYEPSALAVIAFSITWLSMGLLNLVSRFGKAHPLGAEAFEPFFSTLTNIQKSFGQTQVVKNFNMNIEKGEFISFLGPSGCGKTTVLRMIAGFETPTGGTLTINGKDQRPLKPNQRNIGMVFQAYALFPNMTVHDNVAFGMKVAGSPKAEIDKRVKEMLGLIKLDHLADRFPYQMSGGQQQRVALARALAVKPQVLLLDEPLSALDAKIRVSLREEIRQIQQSLGITTVFVTHDQEEALSISDRIVVMNGGKADQIGTPFEIYNTPATRFVASFVGTLNLIEAKVIDPDSNRIQIGDQGVTLKQSVQAYKAGDTVQLALRPEAGSLAEGARSDTALTGEVVSAHFLGSVIRTRMNVGGNVISFDMFNSPGVTPPSAGETVTLRFMAADLLVIRD